MEEFNLDRVEKLFKSNGLKAKENCYFVALKDSRKNQGLIGGANYPYSGLLLDVTEKGIGMFYLKTNKMAFKLDTSKVSIEEDKYFFIDINEIKNITVKKFAILNKKVKTVIIKTNNKSHYLLVDTTDIFIPYQQENFTKFIEKYQ